MEPSQHQQPESDAVAHAQWLAGAIAFAAIVLIVGAVVWSLLAPGGESFRAWFGPTTSPSPAATTATSPPKPTPTQIAGVIVGEVSFPGDGQAAQVICAELVNNTNVSSCVDWTPGNDPSYRLEVPAGRYYVFARLKVGQAGIPTNYRAYYTQFVRCTSTCSPNLHAQNVAVVVTAGETIRDVNPTDWAAGSQ